MDAMRSEDGTIVDVSFAYPEKWTLAKGPNLDVRDVTTSDSAFVLVTPLPKGKTSVADLSPAFFTSLLSSSTSITQAGLSTVLPTGVFGT